VSGWSARLDRLRGSATFFLPRAVSDDELVHPYLAPVAMHFAGWLGHLALHGGAFVAGGGAWAVLAKRGGGKSTTLAELARRGTPILSDDALVIDRSSALAGPRCIDLRPAAAAQFGAELQAVRRGERRRLPLPAITPSARLCGAFVLEWGEALEVDSLPLSERFLALARHCRPEIAAPPALR